MWSGDSMTGNDGMEGFSVDVGCSRGNLLSRRSDVLCQLQRRKFHCIAEQSGRKVSLPIGRIRSTAGTATRFPAKSRLRTPFPTSDASNRDPTASAAYFHLIRTLHPHHSHRLPPSPTPHHTHTQQTSPRPCPVRSQQTLPCHHALPPHPDTAAWRHSPHALLSMPMRYGGRRFNIPLSHAARHDLLASYSHLLLALGLW